MAEKKTYTSVVKDKDKDLLNNTLDDIDVKQIEYLECDDNDTEIQIIITGNIHDDERQAIKSRSNQPAHDAFDRAMQGF